MTDQNYYMLADGQAAENLLHLSNLGKLMAEIWNPDLVSQYEHWIEAFRNSAQTFRGSQNIPENAKPAYSK